MKLLHTADWHAGRSLHGVDRTPEIREVLQELAELAKVEAVDLILVSGDLFDTKNPGADAEAAVYEFFLNTGEAGIPSVVIAGNHDSPSRLDAVSQVLTLAKVHAFGHPKVSKQGGVFDLHLNGETARVAALPFVSERRIVRLADLLGDDPGQWRETYQHGMRSLIQNLTAEFSPNTVNLLLLHTAMNGATLSNSEYTFHCTSSYSLGSDIFPEQANYVALGHIHKPQSVEGFAASTARYAGSIIQLDFGEQADKKYAYIVEAKAGRPTETLKEYAIQSGKRLKRVNVDLASLERRTPELADFEGWLKVAVTLEQPLPGLKDRVKRALPNVLVVEADVPEGERAEAQGVDVTSMNLLEAYEQYYQTERGQAVPVDLRGAFQDLLEQSHDEPENEGGDTAEAVEEDVPASEVEAA